MNNENFVGKRFLKHQQEVETSLHWIDDDRPCLDTLEGHTVITTPQGDIYRGCVLHGVRQGKGILICQDGSEYKGFWINDCFHGTGLYRSTDGSVYIGEWANNIMEVKSTII
jgi:hypothetical protein